MQPLLPPEEFIPYLQKIWNSKQLTNGEPFHQQLEQELCDHLGVKYISLFSNGTLALLIDDGDAIITYHWRGDYHPKLVRGERPISIMEQH
jgi:dTDP-4-amino-4,6-dideoxygalactose transaminase